MKNRRSATVEFQKITTQLVTYARSISAYNTLVSLIEKTVLDHAGQITQQVSWCRQDFSYLGFIVLEKCD